MMRGRDIFHKDDYENLSVVTNELHSLIREPWVFSPSMLIMIQSRRVILIKLGSMTSGALPLRCVSSLSGR